MPILLLSTLGLIADKSISFQIGVNAFNRKPVIENDFLSRIQSWMVMKETVQQSIINELRAYHAQITPHFLFNTFNTIIGLSYKDAKKTIEVLSYLANYFQARLDYHKQQNPVWIEDEIELVQA